MRPPASRAIAADLAAPDPSGIGRFKPTIPATAPNFGAVAAVSGGSRPLPTPCRAVRHPPLLCVSLADDDTDSEAPDLVLEDAERVGDGPSLQHGGAKATEFRTLLCCATQDPAFSGFAVAVATLSVLFEAFPTPAACATTALRGCPLTLTLQDKLAPPPGVKGSHVWFECADARSPSASLPLRVGGVKLPFSLCQLADLFSPGAALVGIEQASAFCPALASCDWPAVTRERAQACAQHSPSTLVCYTDGSYTEQGEGAPLCGWACVLFQPGSCDAWFVYGAFPDYLVERDFCASPFQGEIAGLLAAALVTTAIFPQSAVRFLSDCTSALGIAEGTCAYAPGSVSQAMRHAHWFRSVLVGPGDIYGHVRGHQGHIGNEFWDLLAKAASRRSPASCGLLASRQLQTHWLGAGAPYLPWAGAALARVKGDSTLPPSEWSGIGDDTYHAGLSPQQLLGPFLPEGSLAAAPATCGLPKPAPDSPAAPCEALRLALATFNTLSLGPSAEADDGSMRDTEGLAYRPGRAPLLASQLASHGIQAACLQETCSEAGLTKVGGFLRYASGAVKGQWGTEWWFREHYALSTGGATAPPVCFDERHFAVVHHDARRLFIRFVCRPVRLLFIGAHAPHRATEACALDEWWLSTVRLVKQHSRDESVIFAGDCNAALGSVPTLHVGTMGAETEDAAGEHLHSLLRYLDGCAPSTFADCHSGATHTYTQKRGSHVSRIDYVCVPRSWMNGACTSFPAPGIHAAHSCPDHVATVVAVAVPMRASSDGPRLRRRAFRVSDITAPAHESAIIQALASVSSVAWDVSAHAHAALLVSKVQDTLATFKRKKAVAPHRSYLQPATWQLQQQVAAVRRSLHRLQQRVRCQFLAVCFDTWCGRRQHCGADQGSLWWRAVDVAVAVRQAVLRQWCLRLRKACRDDRAAHLSQLADRISTGPAGEVFQSLHALLGHRRKKPYCPEPLPALKLSDGTPCADGDAILARWRQHFGALEAGRQLSLSAFVEEAASAIQSSRQVALSWPQPDSILDLPTEADVQRLLATAKARKAPGPDGIPAEFGRKFAKYLAPHLHRIVLKTTLSRSGLSPDKPYGFTKVKVRWIAVARIEQSFFSHPGGKCCIKPLALRLSDIFKKALQTYSWVAKLASVSSSAAI